jgi:hypothetical protein
MEILKQIIADTSFFWAAEKPSQNSGNTANAGTYGKLSARKM